MKREDKLKLLQDMSEKELTKRVLIPLFESKGMGCKSVRYTHGVLEAGRDIVYSKYDEYENKIFIGVQVKKIKINQSQVADIRTDIEQGLGTPFKELIDGKEYSLDNFVVLTSNDINETAKESLWNSLKTAKLDKMVKFIDGNVLLSLVEKHLPETFLEDQDYFKKYFHAMKAEFESINEISALGQTEAVPLEEIYIKLKLSEKRRERVHPRVDEFRLFDGLEEEKEERDEERFRIEQTRIVDADKVFNEYKRLVIVGDPGSGKTTLLKHLALKSCLENFEKQERKSVPIFISIREFSDSGLSLEEYIPKVFEDFDFPEAAKYIKDDLKKGTCRLLLDGFDELATRSKLNDTAEKIIEFANKHRACQIIVSSRIAAYNDELTGFTRLELVDFDDAQIKQFIDRWFKVRIAKGKSMFNAIKDNPNIRDLARNPLMITIIAIIYEEDEELPQGRAKLYERYVDVLLSKWDVQKRLKNKYKRDEKEEFLKELAFYGHTNNTRVMTKDKLKAVWDENYERFMRQEEDFEPFINEIWQRSFLLRPRSIDTFDFLHLSLQEYFTALELRGKSNALDIIIGEISNPWWEEVITLYAGIIKSADELIQKIDEQVDEDVFLSNLRLCAKCAITAEYTDPKLRERLLHELWEAYEKPRLPVVHKLTQTALSYCSTVIVMRLALDKLDSGDFHEKYAAVNILGFMRKTQVTNQIIRAMKEEEKWGFREIGLTALSRIGGDLAYEEIVKILLESKDTMIILSAVRALMGFDTKGAVQHLIRVLKSTDHVSLVHEIIEAFIYINSHECLGSLLPLMSEHPDSYLRQKAARAYGLIGGETVVDILIKMLADYDNGISVVSAITALAEIKNNTAIRLLEKIMETNPEDEIRASATWALGRIDGMKFTENFIRRIEIDEDPNVRRCAVNALAYSGGERAISKLSDVVRSGDYVFIRIFAARGLASLGYSRDIRDFLKEVRNTANENVRYDAVLFLGNIICEEIRDHLCETLRIDEDETVRHQAVYRLCNYTSEEVEDCLFNSLKKSRGYNERRAAIATLGKIGSGRAIAHILKTGKGLSGINLSLWSTDTYEALYKISRRTGIRITQSVIDAELNAPS